MMNDRGLDVYHTKVFRWVQEYSPEIDKRSRSHLRPTNDSWRVDETYILVKGLQKYLYRAVDSTGNTLDFLLTAKRDAKAAKRFLRNILKAIHTSSPRVITVDKNPAYPKAIKELKAAKKLPEGVLLRQIKYLNNIVEQDHRGIKRLVKSGMGFGSFNTARLTLRGYEVMNMIRSGKFAGGCACRKPFQEKGQVLGVPKGAVKERILFINQIFGTVA
jgi:transposase, IS6 family